MQTELNFTHLAENNQQSQQHLNTHRAHFEGQCKKLLNLLMAGQRLTVFSALVDHQIGSLPRRALDLKQAGYMITDEPMIGTRIKEWYCTEQDIKHNKTLLQC